MAQTETVNTIQSVFQRAARVGAPVAGGAATLADLAEPVADMALYLTALGAVATLVSGFIWNRWYRGYLQKAMADGVIDAAEARGIKESNRWSLLFSFSLITTVIMALVLVLQTVAGEEDRGVLASNVSALAELQNDLFALKSDVKEIKQTTDKIAVQSGKTAENTEKILTQVDDLVKRFEALDKQGGLDATAPSLQEPRPPSEVALSGIHETPAAAAEAYVAAVRGDAATPFVMLWNKEDRARGANVLEQIFYKARVNLTTIADALEAELETSSFKLDGEDRALLGYTCKDKTGVEKRCVFTLVRQDGGWFIVDLD